jgi:undecaprenyl-phosphate 4-deoxy-4-formamido-L-arabinose transferase
MSIVPKLSIVIPAFNEALNLDNLCTRLINALCKLNYSYEIIVINDGSSDNSYEILTKYYQKYPNHFHIIDFKANYGQHMAIIAGFEQAKGETIITLDADLQNPPEEIFKLIDQIDQGFDYVGSYRQGKRKDRLYRKFCSYLINKIRESITDIKMKDQGCMLRAYDRKIIDQIIISQERATFIPALAYKYAKKHTEVAVKHDARACGESKYNIYSLIRLNFDLITGFSLIPLQMFTIFGMIISFLSGLLVAYMLIRRLIVGPEAQGMFTLFAILMFLVSVLIVGVGLIGEYVGRIFQTLKQSPRYVIERELKPK